ncbi:hypothetical protein K449DRAFT_106401 [Hypoxylon sp. EC38]|nr:hypothetical protein K449DRAFT_106401 [Hypoxylon sp. EC38]
MGHHSASMTSCSEICPSSNLKLQDSVLGKYLHKYHLRLFQVSIIMGFSFMNSRATGKEGKKKTSRLRSLKAANGQR